MTSLLDQFTVDLPALERQKKALRKGILQAQRETVSEVGREAELALEAATAGAGLGKLAKAWNRRVYPRNGLAEDPVAMLYPKGQERTKGAIRAQTRGANIRGRDGMVAVPLPAAALGARNKRPTPEEWERATGTKLIEVQRPGKPALLIATGVRILASGKVRTASHTAIRRGRFASAPIFVLMPQVNIRGRFSIERTVSPSRQRLRDSFVRKAQQLD